MREKNKAAWVAHNRLGATQDVKVDVLFLYRSGKKKRYFTALSHQALASFNCIVQSYHALPSERTTQIDSQTLHEIVTKAELELYNAKDEAWQTVKVLARPILVSQIKTLYSRLMHFIELNHPRLVAIWNGHKWQDNVLHAVNKRFNLPLVYFENGVLPHTSTMDFNGINALNSVPRDASFFRNLSTQEVSASHNIVGRKYKKKAPKKVEFKRPAHYILVPFQKDRDSQILDNSQWIKSMSQLFLVMVEALTLSNRDDLQLVFREHPSAKTKYSALHKLAAKHPRICFDQQSDLCDIIANAEAVVTINSTVGLESLLLDTKVITLGEAFYNIKDLVLSANSVDTLVTQINALHEFKPDRHLLQQFIGYLQHDYVIQGDWKKPSSLHFQAIEQRFSHYLNQMNIDKAIA